MFSAIPTKTVLWIVFLTVVAFASFGLFESLDADQIMVIQNPWTGSLTWYRDAGIKWQGFGKVTKYKKRDQFWFSSKKEKDKTEDESIPIQFNDAGTAHISGSISWEMPLDDKNLTSLHTRYGSHHAIEQQLIRTTVEKAVYMTGTLMSSAQSYAERKNDLINWVDDQITHGVYRTEMDQVRIKDPMSGADKTVNITKIMLSREGLPQRQEQSPVSEFGIKVFNLSINMIVYSPTVQQQVAKQQEATMQVQTAMANAKEAEQRAITAEKNGQAEVVKARYEKEVDRVKEVTLAQKDLDVQTLKAKTAEQYKREQVLRGEGEGAYKRLVMQANGALEQKLDALVQINSRYAEAIKGAQLVPQVVMSEGKDGGATVPGSKVLQLIDLLTVKTAKDLAVDMSVEGAKQTGGRK
jgi:regulator of protease activity HflC (stomatin/prohibitin superfamily)